MESAIGPDVMKIIRQVVFALYSAILAAGAAFAVYAIFDGYQKYEAAVSQYGGRAMWFRGWAVAGEGGTGLILLLLTLVYGDALVRRRTHPLAFIAYVVGYVLCGATFVTTLQSAGKSDTFEGFLATVFWGAVFWLPAVLIAAAGYWLTHGSPKHSARMAE